MNVFSLFSGIGGLELGLERAGMTIVAQVEINPYCRTILAKHWPEVPRHDDVRTCIEWWRSEPRPVVDLVCGGFPCQPVSGAGKRLAQADPRWLWPAFHGVVRALRPRYVLVENVPGLLAAGMGDVLGDLADLGYDAEWDRIPAAFVGAPHLRGRIFIVAYPDSEPLRAGTRSVPSAPGTAQSPASERERFRTNTRDGGQVVADADGSPRRVPAAVFTGTGSTPLPRPAQAGSGRRNSTDNWWAVEPDVGRTLDGFSAWLDRSGHVDQAHKLILAHANAAQADPAETLRTVRDAHGADGHEWAPGGREHLPASAVLLAYLRQLESHGRQAGQSLASAAIPQDGVRGVRLDEEPARPPLRREPSEQRPGQPPDAVRPLSQLLARAAEQAWSAYRGTTAGAVGWGWEDGYARVAHGVPNRLDRLRALGNAVVPQVAEHVGQLIMAADRERGAA